MLFQKTENFKLFWYSLFYAPRYFFEKWEKHCRRCEYVASTAMFFILSPAANQQIHLEYPPGRSIQYPIPAVFGLPVKTAQVRLYQSRQKLTVRRILVWHLEPGEFDSSSSKEYRELLHLVSRNEEKLLSTMTEEQKELLSKYSDAMREFQSLAECLMFQRSFKLGARIMSKVMEE